QPARFPGHVLGRHRTRLLRRERQVADQRAVLAVRLERRRIDVVTEADLVELEDLETLAVAVDQLGAQQQPRLLGEPKPVPVAIVVPWRDGDTHGGAVGYPVFTEERQTIVLRDAVVAAHERARERPRG